MYYLVLYHVLSYVEKLKNENENANQLLHFNFKMSNFISIMIQTKQGNF